MASCLTASSRQAGERKLAQPWPAFSGKLQGIQERQNLAHTRPHGCPDPLPTLFRGHQPPEKSASLGRLQSHLHSGSALSSSTSFSFNTQDTRGSFLPLHPALVVAPWGRGWPGGTFPGRAVVDLQAVSCAVNTDPAPVSGDRNSHPQGTEPPLNFNLEILPASIAKLDAQPRSLGWATRAVRPGVSVL